VPEKKGATIPMDGRVEGRWHGLRKLQGKMPKYDFKVASPAGIFLFSSVELATLFQFNCRGVGRPREKQLS